MTRELIFSTYTYLEELLQEVKKHFWWLVILAALLFALFIITLQIAFTFFISWFAVSIWAALGFQCIAIGCIIFEKIFWPWYAISFLEEQKEPTLIDEPGVCPICGPDEEDECILRNNFDEKTIRAVSARTLSFKGETVSLKASTLRPRNDPLSRRKRNAERRARRKTLEL